MSLDTVVEDIRDEARARAEEILDDAEERAAEIREEAEREADEIVEQRERDVERRIDQEREQKIASAKLEAKQQRLEARRDVLESVRAAAEAAIADLEGEDREELTRALLSAGIEELNVTDDVAVYGRADDRELIESILEDYDGFAYAGEYDCLGGVVLESEASDVRVNNTFDSVLERVWEDDLKDISARLFDQ